MGLPKAVQEQQDMAEQLEEQVYGEDNPDPAVDETTSQSDTGDKSQSQTPAEDDDYWQRRFETLQGKYNAEVRQVAQENQQLQDKLQQTDSNAAELREQLQQLRAQQPTNVTEHFTQAQIDEFGEDTLALMHRHAESVADQRVQEAVQQMQGQVQEVQQTQQQNAADRFLSDVAQAVPDWQQINDDPAFHQWLEAAVTVTTPQGQKQMSRQQLLSQYEQAGNARDVIALFQAFKETQSGEQQVQAESEAPPKATGSGRVEPSDSGPAPWTRDQITEFYRHKNRDMKRDPEGTQAREAELDRAVAAGRVV